MTHKSSQNITSLLVRGLCLILMPMALLSCIYDYPTDDTSLEDEASLSIGFKIPLTKAPAAGNEYEAGILYENWIDIAGKNYRILFYDTEKKFITQFVPFVVTPVAGTDYTEYSVRGAVPAELMEYNQNNKDFKVVVIANWENYPTVEQLKNTTIQDLCTAADWSQYSAKTDFTLSKTNLIPFYGVHEYSETFVKGTTTVLAEPVSLLRAMAKVEILMEKNEVCKLSNVSIQRYNEKGYCAPSGIFTEDDYDHNGDWDNDFVRGVHLIGNQNDEGDKSLDFAYDGEVKITMDGTIKSYDKWYAYVPEYRNIGVEEETISFVNVTLNFINEQAGTNDPLPIYFAEYIAGKPTKEHLNIERNNLYRYYVTATATPLKFYITVDTWVYGGTVHIDL